MTAWTDADRTHRTPPGVDAALALLSDDELAAMTRRAYFGAAAAWRDLNKPIPNGPYSPDDGRAVRMSQHADAEALDDWYERLGAERNRRLGSLVLSSVTCYHCGEPTRHAQDCQWNTEEA